jgi:hypothetical protein
MPLWAVTLTCLILTTAGFGAFLELAVPGVRMAVTLAGGLGFGVPTTVLIGAAVADLRFRRVWTRTERIAMARAYRTGAAPADPAAYEAVRAMIVRKRRLLGRWARYGPWSGALFGLGALVSMVSDRATTVIPGLIFLGALTAYSRLAPPRSLRRLDRLEIAIADRKL